MKGDPTQINHGGAGTRAWFTIADPRDPGMLDVVGFDASVPQALREFAQV